MKRINPHTSEDNQAKYRPADEVGEAGQAEPLVRFESWLEDQRWLTPARAEQVHQEAALDAGQAADWAEAQSDPDPAQVLSHVFLG